MNKQMVESLAIAAATTDSAECESLCTTQELRDLAVDAWRALCSSVHVAVVENARDEFVAAYVDARS